MKNAKFILLFCAFVGAFSVRAQEEISEHIVRVNVIPKNDAQALKGVWKEWKSFVETNVPSFKGWDLYEDTNNRIWDVSFLSNYAQVDEEQKQWKEAFAKYQATGKTSLMESWVAGSHHNAVSMFRYRSDLSYVNGDLNMADHPYRKIYWAYPKRDRMSDFAKALELMKEIDAELGIKLHRYVYECDFGDEMPLIAMVLPGKSQLQYLQGLAKRDEMRATSKKYAQMMDLFEGASRKTEHFHLTHLPEISRKVE